MEAFADDRRGKAITNDDPRNEYTYGEFPCDSFDFLVDRALELMADGNNGGMFHNEDGNKIMVDLGSGCGRLVFYAALTRGGTSQDDVSSTTQRSTQWDVHGVEIGTQLHSLAVNSLQRGVDNGWFTSIDNESDANGSQIVFHNGNALPVEDPFFQFSQSTDDTPAIQTLLSRTSLLFAYSTVWETDPTQQFHPELGAMILSPKWSQTLASQCQNGCVAITTDRALNPEHGWKLLDRMDVENPSVWGSVGYISVLLK
jgi:hypothetical protein